MALDDLRRTSQSDAPGDAETADRPVSLRMLRVESVYRRETRLLPREERDRYSNFLWNMMRLDPGPRVTVSDLVGRNQDALLDTTAEQGLKVSVDYYHGRGDTAGLIQVCKFFCAYLMQQARKEGSFSAQQFLLFKVMDLGRTIVQFSPHAANAEAEALVFGLFVDMGTHRPERFRSYMEQEEQVYQLMRRLQALPNDATLRFRLAERLEAQTSFFDALVQYQTLLRRFPPREGVPGKIHGQVFGRLAGLFQNLAEHASPGLQDGRKLKNFIDRYNRSYAGRGGDLPRLTDAHSRRLLERVRNALLEQANRWAQAGAVVPALEPRRRAQLLMQQGQNLVQMERPKAAVAVLEDGNGVWSRVPAGKAGLEEQAAYLRLLTSAAHQCGARDAFDRGMRELTDVQGRLGDIERQERERRQRRAALLG